MTLSSRDMERIAAAAREHPRPDDFCITYTGLAVLFERVAREQSPPRGEGRARYQGEYKIGEALPEPPRDGGPLPHLFVPPLPPLCILCGGVEGDPIHSSARAGTVGDGRETGRDKPRPHGSTSQQGPATSSTPTALPEGGIADGAVAANVAKQEAASDRASHVAPGPSPTTSSTREGEGGDVWIMWVPPSSPRATGVGEMLPCPRCHKVPEITPYHDGFSFVEDQWTAHLECDCDTKLVTVTRDKTSEEAIARAVAAWTLRPAAAAAAEGAQGELVDSLREIAIAVDQVRLGHHAITSLSAEDVEKLHRAAAELSRLSSPPVTEEAEGLVKKTEILCDEILSLEYGIQRRDNKIEALIVHARKMAAALTAQGRELHDLKCVYQNASQAKRKAIEDAGLAEEKSASLTSEVEALRRERDELKQAFVRYEKDACKNASELMGRVFDNLNRAETAEAAVARAQKVADKRLLEYGSHKGDCSSHAGPECYCGWEEIKRGLERSS